MRSTLVPEHAWLPSQEFVPISGRDVDVLAGTRSKQEFSLAHAPQPRIKSVVVTVSSQAPATVQKHCVAVGEGVTCAMVGVDVGFMEGYVLGTRVGAGLGWKVGNADGIVLGIALA